jgi:hypothetical protein
LVVSTGQSTGQLQDSDTKPVIREGIWLKKRIKKSVH